METDYSTPLITVALQYFFTLYRVYISFTSVQMHTKMNETGKNMVSYSTCHLKYLHDVDIRASDINIGASYGQVFIWVNYIYIGPYHTNIEASQVQLFVGVNNIDIVSSDIDII